MPLKRRGVLFELILARSQFAARQPELLAGERPSGRSGDSRQALFILTGSQPAARQPGLLGAERDATRAHLPLDAGGRRHDETDQRFK
jgi:hypothetical protein